MDAFTKVEDTNNYNQKERILKSREQTRYDNSCLVDYVEQPIIRSKKDTDQTELLHETIQSGKRPVSININIGNFSDIFVPE